VKVIGALSGHKICLMHQEAGAMRVRQWAL